MVPCPPRARSTDGCCPHPLAGMNAAVRAVTRMGIYVGAKVFLIYEVRSPGWRGVEGGGWTAGHGPGSESRGGDGEARPWGAGGEPSLGVCGVGLEVQGGGELWPWRPGTSPLPGVLPTPSWGPSPPAPLGRPRAHGAGPEVPGGAMGPDGLLVLAVPPPAVVTPPNRAPSLVPVSHLRLTLQPRFLGPHRAPAAGLWDPLGLVALGSAVTLFPLLT